MKSGTYIVLILLAVWVVTTAVHAADLEPVEDILIELQEGINETPEPYVPPPFLNVVNFGQDTITIVLNRPNVDLGLEPFMPQLRGTGFLGLFGEEESIAEEPVQVAAENETVITIARQPLIMFNDPETGNLIIIRSRA